MRAHNVVAIGWGTVMLNLFQHPCLTSGHMRDAPSPASILRHGP